MPSDLASSPLLGSTAFHLLASPDLAKKQIQKLLSLRESNSIDARPLLVWEPLPGSCKADLRDDHFAVAKLVDIFSPNHLELQALFKDSGKSDSQKLLDRRSVEEYAERLLDCGIGLNGRWAVIIRAGGDGCLISSNSLPERHRWLPAFYDNHSVVVDATGAGNTFLGALAFAISACGHDLVKASALASVAASFSLQQIGLPSLCAEGENRDNWNGDTFARRCEIYRAKIAHCM